MYLIDKEKLKERFLEEYPQAYYPMHFVKIIDELPLVEKRNGEWIYSINDESVCEEWTCSLCGQFMLAKTNYCPYCGAKMENINEL